MAKPQLGPRINENIKGTPQVRLIDEDVMVGIIPINRALQIAREKNLDLIEIDPKGSPPICKIMDLGKFKYEMKKKEKSQKVKKTSTREFKLGLRIEDHDLEIKLKKCKEFLLEGDNVRLSVRFFGRELAYKGQGEDLLKKIIAALSEAGKTDFPIKMDGHTMSVIVIPK